MARVAIVSYDVQTIRGKSGGVGAFTTRWANMLRKSGDDVTIVLTRTDWEPVSVDLRWRARYQANGIGLIELQSPPPLPTRWPEVATMRISELAAPVLKGFDIVYLQDWGNAGFHLLRNRRYSIDQGPVCVTVLHGPSEWELSSNQQYPKLPDDLHLAYQERYCAKHSDFVVSPSAYMVNHLSSLGWEFPADLGVLGLPMPLPEAEQSSPAPAISQIVYFGRVEERKGIRLFVKAMEQLAKLVLTRPHVVLLGTAEDTELLKLAKKRLKAIGFGVTQLGSLDNNHAVKYLQDNAAKTLCVIPSPADNFPYTVVEASLVPGLNLIACLGGGVPEILQGAEQQLSEPQPSDLAAKIAERLGSPLGAAELARYDCEVAEERWLNFHRKALASIETRDPKTLPQKALAVDVCSTYYRKAEYLPQLVDALEHQTTQNFQLIVVNDGSPDEESNRVFVEQSNRGAKYGWEFFHQKNSFVDAARNTTAAHGKNDLILFIDSDDVPAKHAVERMRDAITLSGDDALICSSYLFASDRSPYDLKTGEITVPAFAMCIPLGMDMVGGIVNPSSFGGSMFMVRRGAFEALGGFTTKRGAGHEDWEMYVRLTLAGFKVDVMSDVLHFYRQAEGSLARTLDTETSKQRLLEAYEERMRAAGLGGGALALAGLYANSKQTEARIKMLRARSNAPKGGFSFFPSSTRQFESESNGIDVGRLRQWYRSAFSLEMRLKIHEVFLAPFVGPYEPPPA